MSAAPPPLALPPGAPPRWTRRALPGYRHVPGLTPHPVTDARGHAHGVPAPALPAGGLDLPAGWQRCEPYLFGVDLFNQAYLWEAHEAWEAVWHAVGHDSEPGLFLQGLIQSAAALLQAHRRLARGATSNLRKAELRFARVPRGADGRYMGVPLDEWRGELDAAVAGAGGYPFLRLG